VGEQYRKDERMLVSQSSTTIDRQSQSQSQSQPRRQRPAYARASATPVGKVRQATKGSSSPFMEGVTTQREGS
jgi:hypothetical protein